MRGSYPGVPVVVLTKSVDPADHARAIEAVADGVPSNAADIDEVLAAMKRRVGG